MYEESGLGFVKGNLPYSELADKIPFVTGSFTGWRYKPMVRLDDFCKYLDSNEETLVDRHKVDQERSAYAKEWPRIFKKFLKYKNPCLINQPSAALAEDVFCLPFFGKPGRHTYLV